MADTMNNEEKDILYDGGFDIWLKRLSALLSQHHLEHHLEMPVGSHYVHYRGETRARAAAAQHMSMAMIDHRVLHRVPSESKGSLPNLVYWLKTRTRPFPFMELPPEIRNRIYTYVIPEGNSLTVRPPAQGGSQAADTRPPPETSIAITQVSRLIRRKSLPLFYARSVIKLRGPAYVGDQHAMNKVCNWFKIMPAGQISNLSTVIFLVSMKGSADRSWNRRIRDCGIILSYDRTTGFTMRPNKRLDVDSREKIKAYALQIERARGFSKLKGESIPMALTMDEDMWKPDTFSIK